MNRSTAMRQLHHAVASAIAAGMRRDEVEAECRRAAAVEAEAHAARERDR